MPTFVNGVATAARLRKALRAAFPATTFSVRTTRYAASAPDIDVKWVDGPTAAAVLAITDGYHGNQMIDGQAVHFGVGSITVERAYSPAMRARIETEVAADLGEPFARGRFYPSQGAYGSDLFWRRFCQTSGEVVAPAVAA